MSKALFRHGVSSQLHDWYPNNAEKMAKEILPLDGDTAFEIAEALDAIIYHFENQGKRPSRTTLENLKATALAHHLIQMGMSQEDAAVAAFPNEAGADATSLARTFRNLLPTLQQERSRRFTFTAPFEVLREKLLFPRKADVQEALGRYLRVNNGIFPKIRKPER